MKAKVFLLAHLIAFGVLFGILFSCSNDEVVDNNPVVAPEPFQGNVAWIRTFGGSDEDVAQTVIETNDGGYAILGFTKSTDGDIAGKTTSVNDFWLLKLDSEGNLLWNQTYGGSDDDRGQSLIQTSDGGYVLAGYSKSSDGDSSNNEGQHDNWVIKVDASGNLQWEQSFGFAGHDHAYSIIETADGGLFMTGFLDVTSSGGAGNDGRSVDRVQHGVGEFWAHRLDANGNLLWRRYFGGTNNDRSFDAVQTPEGGFLIAGTTESNDVDISNNHGSYDVWLINVSSNGDLLWERTFGGSGIDNSNAIIASGDGNYLIAGNTFSTDMDVSAPLGSSDFWLLKIDPSGSLLWEKSFGGTDFELARALCPTYDGRFWVVGHSKSLNNDVSENNGMNDFWIIRVDASGSLEWERSFGGSGLDFAHGVVETASGSAIIVGETESADGDIPKNQGLKDVLVIKIQ